MPSSNYDAATIPIQWSNVQQNDGSWLVAWNTYTDAYDVELDWLSNLHKKAIIVLWYLDNSANVNSCDPTLQWMPEFVWTDMGSSNYGCYTSPASEGSNKSLIPYYGNAKFISDWQTYVSAVATHFANGAHPDAIAYIRGNLGQGGETMPCGHEPLSDNTDTMTINGGSPVTCKQQFENWTGDSTNQTLYGWYADWLKSRLSDEETDFPYAYVVAPENNWEGGVLKTGCTYQGVADPGTGQTYSCLFHNEWIYDAVSNNLGGVHQSVVGFNGLAASTPNDDGKIIELDEGIAQYVQTSTFIVHYQFQETQQASSAANTETEATHAWCYSESDDGADGGDTISPQAGINDLTSVEWYRNDWTAGYTTGITDFPTWEDGSVDPMDPDDNGSSGFCHGL